MGLHNQGSLYDHLRPLQDGGQVKPTDFKAAPADEAVPAIRRGGSARKT
jgi:hypothetical protein